MNNKRKRDTNFKIKNKKIKLDRKRKYETDIYIQNKRVKLTDTIYYSIIKIIHNYFNSTEIYKENPEYVC